MTWLTPQMPPILQRLEIPYTVHAMYGYDENAEKTEIVSYAMYIKGTNSEGEEETIGRFDEADPGTVLYSSVADPEETFVVYNVTEYAELACAEYNGWKKEQEKKQ